MTFTNSLIISAVLHLGTILSVSLTGNNPKNIIIPVELTYNLGAGTSGMTATTPVSPPKQEPAKKTAPILPEKGELTVPTAKKNKSKPLPPLEAKHSRPLGNAASLNKTSKGSAAGGGKEGAGGTGLSSRAIAGAVEFPFSYYLRTIQDKIAQEWNWSSSSGWWTSVIKFKILRNGEIEGPEIHKSSGEPLFDKTCARAVALAAPYPPLPIAYNKSELEIFFEFNFAE